MIQKLTEADRPEVKDFINEQWHAPHISIKGQLYYPHQSEGYIIRRDDKIAGLVTFRGDGDSIQMLTLNNTKPGTGLGYKLVLQVIDEARKRNADRVWLTTTNDNLKAIGFYQRLGFRLEALYRGAIDQARKTIKKEIPEYGFNGLPIHDEIEMVLTLKPFI